MKLTDLDETILTDVIKPRPQESYKGTFGKILLVGGNHQFGGAIMMATAAAVYSGTGLVTVACDPTNITALHTQLPEAMAIDFTDKAALTGMIKRVNTVVVGPGLGEEAASLRVLKNVFAATMADQTVVIDGSAITLLAREGLALPAGHLVFTPHQMEWQRLSEIEIKHQTPEANKAAQEKLGGIVVVKRHHSEIYTPAGDWRLPRRLAGWATPWPVWSAASPPSSGTTGSRRCWRPPTPTRRWPTSWPRTSTSSCPTRSARPCRPS